METSIRNSKARCQEALECIEKNLLHMQQELEGRTDELSVSLLCRVQSLLGDLIVHSVMVS